MPPRFLCMHTYMCVAIIMYQSCNALLTGDTQEQVTEQDEDSDDVPGRFDQMLHYTLVLQLLC